MYNKEIVVRCESGLHNKQATYFVQKANEFKSVLYIEKDEKRMNAKSLLGIFVYQSGGNLEAVRKVCAGNQQYFRQH